MYLLVEFDKSGAEWVVVAYDANDERMIEVTNSDISPHVITGSLITGASHELVTQDEKLVGHITDAETIHRLREESGLDYSECTFLPRVMSIRQAGKKSNHGLNYDMGYMRFALENEMPPSESKQIVELYRTKAYPGIPRWHRNIRDELSTSRTLRNCFGRKR